VTESPLSLRAMGVDAARVYFSSLLSGGGAPTMWSVENLAVPVPVRVYRPGGGGGRTIIVYLHGGGWVMGDLDTGDADCRSLASRCNAVVVSVNYRLAPEYPFPCGLDDCVEAIEWVISNADRLGGDARRVALVGVSSGGNLAAAAIAAVRGRVATPPRALVLVYPMIDGDIARRSYAEYGEGFGLTTDTVTWYWSLYAADAQRHDPRVRVLENDLSAFPSTLVVVAEQDPLCDEGAEFAARLHEAGVATTLEVAVGQRHGFFSNAPRTPFAERIHAMVAAWIRSTLVG
jgi:acetyl esterase